MSPELTEAVACVKRIHARRHDRGGDPHSWKTLLVYLRAYASSAESRPPKKGATRGDVVIPLRERLRERAARRARRGVGKA